MIALAGIIIISAATTACDGGGEAETRMCQFDGCTNKASGFSGEFCDYHSKMLNDYWDASDAADNYN